VHNKDVNAICVSYARWSVVTRGKSRVGLLGKGSSGLCLTTPDAWTQWQGQATQGSECPVWAVCCGTDFSYRDPKYVASRCRAFFTGIRSLKGEKRDFGVGGIVNDNTIMDGWRITHFLCLKDPMQCPLVVQVEVFGARSKFMIRVSYGGENMRRGIAVYHRS
jgi:hypothetical protein